MFLTSGHNDTERVHGPNNTVTRRFQICEVLPRAGNGRWMRRNRNWKENCTSEQFGRRVVSDGGTVCLLGLWGAERELDWLAPTHAHLVSFGRKSPRFIHLGFIFYYFLWWQLDLQQVAVLGPLVFCRFLFYVVIVGAVGYFSCNCAWLPMIRPTATTVVSFVGFLRAEENEGTALFLIPRTRTSHCQRKFGGLMVWKTHEWRKCFERETDQTAEKWI